MLGDNREKLSVSIQAGDEVFGDLQYHDFAETSGRCIARNRRRNQYKIL